MGEGPPTDRVLVLFTKAPVQGQVKTRLGQSLGDEAAVNAHVQLVQHALLRLAHVPDVATQLWLSEPHAQGERWAAQYDLPYQLQSGAGLGQRMGHVFTSLFAAGVRQVVLVGTDCPDIDAKYVGQAFDALLERPAVFGPAEDGGYGLVGLSQTSAPLVPQVFQQINWGSDQVMVQTRHQLRQLGLTWQELEQIWDVDQYKDWQRYLDNLAKDDLAKDDLAK